MSRTGTISILATLAVLVGIAGWLQRHDAGRGGGGTGGAKTLPSLAEVHAVTLHRSPAPQLFARLAAGADGSLHLAWIEPGKSGSRLMERRLSPQGWLPPEAGVRVPSPALLTGTAVDSGGKLHALYLTRQGEMQRVFHAQQNGSGWLAPRELTVANASAHAARLAIGRSGALHTAWYAAEQHNAAVIYRVRNGSGWGEGQQVSPSDPKKTFWSPDLAVGPDDTLHLTYFTLSVGGTAAYYTRKSPDGGWLPPHRLSQGHKFATSPRVAVDPVGDPHVVWNGGKDNLTLFYARRQNGKWSAPEAIAARPAPPRNVALAVDQQGVVYAAWREDNATGASDIFLSSGRNLRWSPAVNVSHSAGASYGVTAGIVGTTLHLAWTEAAPDGTGGEIRWLRVPLKAPQG